ncbi:unnamed protein product, partial [Ectocarpus sp. 4 AP-2014]
MSSRFPTTLSVKADASPLNVIIIMSGYIESTKVPTEGADLLWVVDDNQSAAHVNLMPRLRPPPLRVVISK